jgi:hypothetical protein
MDSFGKFTVPILVGMGLVATAGHTQNAVQIGAIETQLTQLYQTAKPTADGTDLVTAGSVLVLQKDHLVMSAVDQPVPTPNTYKNGAITNSGLAGAANVAKLFGKLGSFIPGASGAAQASSNAGDTAGAGKSREFVAGEKFFVTKIDTHPDGVVLALLSDPIKDVRYRATLKFPFAKGTMPSPDDVAAMVAEVVKIDAPDNAQDQNASSQQGAAAAPAQTKTIAIGQTRDQVIAMFGVPSKVVQLGKKEIDIFPDMKVTFVQSKVVDVQ